MRLLLLLAFMLLTSFGAHAQAELPAFPRDLSEITLENVQNLQSLVNLTTAPINDIAWSSDGTLLAVATDSSVQIYDFIAGEQRTLGNNLNFSQVSFVANTHHLFVDWGYNAAIHDADTLERLTSLESRGVLSHDGTLYALGGTDFVTVLSVETGEEVHRFPAEQFDPLCEVLCTGMQAILFSPDDTHLVFSSSASHLPATIVNLQTGESIAPVELGYQGFSFSLDGSIIASRAGVPGYFSRSTLLTSAETGRALATIELFGAYGAPAFNRDHSLLVVGGMYENAPNPDEAWGVLYFFDTQQVIELEESSGVEIALATVDFADWIKATSFSPDFRLLAVGDDSGHLTILGIPAE